MQAHPTTELPRNSFAPCEERARFLGFWIQFSSFRVYGLRCWVEDLGFREKDVGCGFPVSDLGFRIKGLGCRV